MQNIIQPTVKQDLILVNKKKLHIIPWQIFSFSK